MDLSEDQKLEMMAATHECALAMVDDLHHIREIIAKPEPTAGDIRRTSNILRRLLIDNNGDLRKIAPPRIGKTHLLAPDLKPLFRSGDREPWTFLSTARAKIFGIHMDAVMIYQTARRPLAGYDPDKTVLLTLDQFNSQRVICFQGKWITRRDIITYVANVAHGVHSGDPKEPAHELIRKIRHAATIKLENDVPTINFNVDALALDDKPLIVDRNAIDFILLHLISAAQHLTTSPDVLRLEEEISREEPQ